MAPLLCFDGCVDFRHMRAVALCLALPLILLFSGTTARAQGCAQCLDSNRHAILLLGGSAITVFVSGIFLLRKVR